MFARPRRTAVCLALLLGMVYGLGAAPCGCWEHSGWRAAVVAFSDGPMHPPTDADGWSNEDCHGQATATALPFERLRAEDAAALAVTGFTAKDASAVPPLIAHACAFGVDESAAIAPPVRAETQVFRL